MRILIAGSSGLIGSALATSLERGGHEVRRLIRPATVGDGIPWDPDEGTLDPAAFDGVDGVVNLGGRSIGDHRWSDREKHLLWESRIPSARLIAERMAAAPTRPGVLINASAVGYYGDQGDRVLTEADGPGSGFLAELTQAWEAATAPASAAGIRVVTLRSGIVLSDAGGAMGRLLAPFGPRWLSPYRWGLGGPVAGGKQYWSWISLEDEIRAIVHLLIGDVSGPVNLTSPAPATNREFVKALGRALHRPAVMPIPGFVIRIVLGSELAEAMVLDGQRVRPARLEAGGFEFRDTDLDRAMRTAVGR